MKISALSAIVAGLAVFSIGSPASAATQETFSLNETAVSGFSLLPAGTVTVSTVNSTTLRITLSLISGYRIHASGNGHNALDFVTDKAVTISGLPGGFSIITPPDVKAPPFDNGGNADWNNAISCGSPACGSGFAGGYKGPLTFTISNAGGLSISDLLAPCKYSAGTCGSTGSPIYFASDLVNSEGKTGNVGATFLRSTPGPAPGAGLPSFALLILVGGAIRLRRSFM